MFSGLNGEMNMAQNGVPARLDSHIFHLDGYAGGGIVLRLWCGCGCARQCVRLVTLGTIGVLCRRCSDTCTPDDLACSVLLRRAEGFEEAQHDVALHGVLLSNISQPAR